MSEEHSSEFIEAISKFKEQKPSVQTRIVEKCAMGMMEMAQEGLKITVRESFKTELDLFRRAAEMLRGEGITVKETSENSSSSVYVVTFELSYEIE